LPFLLNSIIKFIRRYREKILLVILVSLATLLLNVILSAWLSSFHNLRIPSVGTIRVIGVEAFGGDINTTQNGGQFIDWGSISTGTTTNRSFYIKSISNEPIILQLEISNLTFQNSNGKILGENLPLENPLRLTWNYSGEPLNPKECIYVILTLEVSAEYEFVDYIISNDVKQFCFDITIKLDSNI